ncbi:MAG: NAD-dependent epimerase/dehydratase family protein, partial [Thermoanaerobaculia bacterium]
MAEPAGDYSIDTSESSSVSVAEQPEPLAGTRNKLVVITGASGLVGTHVCSELANAGCKIRALVRDAMKAAQRLGHLPIEIRVADIRNADSM